MWASIGCFSHSHSINMFTPPYPTHLEGASGNFSLKKLKSKWRLEKNFFDNMHKPRLSLILKNIIKKKKMKKNFFSYEKKIYEVCLIVHFSDTFFLYFQENL